MRRALAALVLVVGAVALAAPAGAVPAPTVAAPRVTLSTQYPGLGDGVFVTGRGWPGRALVRVTLCGNNALDGSADCDVASAVTAGVGADGSFSTRLTVTRPPSPCPCVVSVSNATSASPSVKAPITVVGVPAQTPHSRVPDTGKLVVIENAHVSGNGPWTSWFGGSSDRTLFLTLHDTGSIPVPSPQLTVTWGKGSNASQFVDVPRVPTLRPGERRVVRVPLTLDAFSWGTYTVTGGVIGYDAEFTTTTSDYWWGWFAIAFVVFNFVLWRVLRRISMRRERRRTTRVITAGERADESALGEDAPALK